MARRLCFVCGFLLAAGWLSHVSAAAQPPVVLGGPEVLKLDWNTRSLVHGDINNNGRNDLAVINNDRGSIEVLFRRGADEPPAVLTRRARRNRWEPVLDSAAYDRRAVVTGQVAHALVLGDFNGSGRLDLAFTGNRVPLTILHQNEEGDFTERWETRVFDPRQWPGSIRAVDLNRNGRTDLVVLAEEDVIIFLQNAEGVLEEPVRHRLASADSSGLRVVDIDGDGLPDIAYLSGDGAQRHLAVRFQYSGGGFGPEYLFPMDVAHTSHAFVDDGEDAPLLVYAEQRTGIVRTARLARISPAAEPRDGVSARLQARSHTLPVRLRDRGLYAIGDFAGNGRKAVVAANPSRAEILYFVRNEAGDFGGGTAFPSLSSISATATLRHPRLRAEALVVASADEGLVGVSKLTERGRFDFPSLIPVEGRPILLCAGTVREGEEPAVIVLEKRGRDFFLTIARLAGTNPLRWETASHPLDGVNRDPRAIFPASVDGREPHLVLLGQREAVRIFRMREDGPEEVAPESDLRRSLLGNVEPHELTLVPGENGTAPRWLLAGDGFVRVLRFHEGDFRIEDQFNARAGSNRLRLPLARDGDFLVFDTDANELHIHRPDHTGVVRFVDAVSLPPVTPLAAGFFKMGGDDRDSLHILGEERFMVLSGNRPRFEFVDAHEPHETDLEDMRYMGFESGDFSRDGAPDLVAIDARNHVLEILGIPRGNHGWRSYLHFTLFERNVNMGPRRGAGGFQPREALVADFTGDGHPDIALLIHDRLLIYPGGG